MDDEIRQAKTGLSFGLTSAIITTLGTMAGLYSVSNSRFIIISGILSLAIADSFSDAMGIHLSEESENVHTTKEVWISTGITFATKFSFTLVFVIPVIFFHLSTAFAVDIIFGIFILTVLSVLIARAEKAKILPVVLEHDLIAIVAILVAGRVGTIVRAVIQLFS